MTLNDDHQIDCSFNIDNNKIASTYRNRVTVVVVISVE